MGPDEVGGLDRITGALAQSGNGEVDIPHPALGHHAVDERLQVRRVLVL